MDNSLHTQFDISPVNPALLTAADESVGWLRRPIAGLRMADDDDFEEEDDWTEDDLEDDDLEEDDEDDWDDDDDLEDDDLEDDDFEDDDFDDDDLEDDSDDYEYEYRGDTGWDDGDSYDEDEYNLLGTRFASLLNDPPSGPKRFRDREGMSAGDKRPKKSHRPRVTKRSPDEIENDDD